MRLSALAVLLILFPCIEALADVPSPIASCNAALAKDITTTFSSQQQDLDFLSIVDEQTYSQAKTKGSFGVSVPIADDLLKLSGNYDDFKEKRRKYFNLIHNTSHTSAQDFRHFEITSPVAYQAWTTCVLAFARQGTGIFAWKQQEDKDNIIIQVMYHTPGSAKHVPFRAYVKRGGEPEKSYKTNDTTVVNEQLLTFAVSRSSVSGETAPKSFVMRFQAGQFSDYVYSVWSEPPPKPIYTSTTSNSSIPCVRWLNEFQLQGLKPTNDTQLIGTVCTAPGDVTKVTYDKCQGEGCDHIWYMGEANIIQPDKKSVNVRFRTNHGQPPPLLSMTIYYTITTSTCSGEGCAVRLPTDALANCPATGCTVLGNNVPSLGKPYYSRAGGSLLSLASFTHH